MKLSRAVKPVSYLKAHAAEVLRDLTQDRQPLVVTQNGRATAVLQDIESYEQTQETLALLKILALGERQAADEKVVPASAAVARIRKRAAEQ